MWLEVWTALARSMTRSLASGHAAWLMIVIPSCFACQTPSEDLRDEDLRHKPSGTTWDDLFGGNDNNLLQNPLGMVMPPPAASPPAAPGEDLTPRAWPACLRALPPLARLPFSQSQADPAAYEGGVLGVVGTTKIFVADSGRIADDARLYWVQVKVLSEKYGCFITAKRNLGERTWIRCRDGRQVVFWKSRGPGFVQFRAKQFDTQGYEIVVRHRRIERVSNEQVL